MDSGLILKLFILTWNVAEKPPPTELKTVMKPVEEGPFPEMYIIGLQEMKFFSDEWIKATDKIMSVWEYVLVGDERLCGQAGIMVRVFVLKSKRESVNNIEKDSKSLGVNLGIGSFPNKGATAVRLTYQDVPIVFVNSHLAPHTEGCEKRKKQMLDIDQSLFNNRDMFKNNLIFWFGDLNFRLKKECPLDIPQTTNLIYAKKAHELLKYDELLEMINTKKILDEDFPLKEAKITFPPTFKFKPDTDEYVKRRPAWTDRILYKDNENVKITPITYKSVESVKISDHKPVTGLFEVRDIGDIEKTDTTKINQSEERKSENQQKESRGV